MPVITLSRVSTAYGHLPLLEDADLQIEAGERIAILGRNGTGKSTLLKILNAEVIPDAGVVWRAPAMRSARLDQDVPLVEDRSVFDTVADGLGDLGQLVKDYHHAATALAIDHSETRLAEFGRL